MDKETQKTWKSFEKHLKKDYENMNLLQIKDIEGGEKQKAYIFESNEYQEHTGKGHRQPSGEIRIAEG